MGECSNAALIVETRGRSKDRRRGKSRSKSQGRSKSKGKFKLECWHCGKKGHIKKDCWNRKGKESDSSNNNNESTSNQEANIVGELVQDALIMSHERNGDYGLLIRVLHFMLLHIRTISQITHKVTLVKYY